MTSYGGSIAIPRAYSSQINTALFNATIALIIETTEATKKVGTLRQELHGNPMYDPHVSTDFFGPLSIRYVGELLERYEEKIDGDIAHTRAIALALAYARSILTDNMFIGCQREDFLQKATDHANGDAYLTAALYMLAEDDCKAALRSDLLDFQYADIASLILALCALKDAPDAFATLMPQLNRLLGVGHSFDVIGNASMIAWLLCEYNAPIRACRGKSGALLRALLKLSECFVKETDRAHTVLLDAGYSPYDILYLCSMFVWQSGLPNGLNKDSIPAEKLATAFVLVTLNRDIPPSPETRDYVEWLLHIYSRFEIKYQGFSGLEAAVMPRLHVVSPDTLVWLWKKDLFKFRPHFDVMDSKWDLLASELPEEKYHRLFRIQFEDIKQPTPQILQQMLSRYQSLVGKDYALCFNQYNHEERTVFFQLVSADIINLWDFFNARVPRENEDSNGLKYVWDSTSGVMTPQAFAFWKTFFEKYSLQDIRRFWGYVYFHNAFVKFYYGASHDKPTLRRDFLSREQNRQLCEWVDESVFHTDPSNYMNFALRFLRSDDATTLYTSEELRHVFDQLRQCNLAAYEIADLRTRFLNEAELEAERAAADAEKQRQKEERKRQDLADMRSTVTEKCDGTYASLEKLLQNNWWRHNHVDFAKCVKEKFNGLQREHTNLTRKECGALLTVCSYMMQAELMGVREVTDVLESIVIVETQEDNHAENE